MVNPVAKLENAIFQQLQSRLYHPKSTQQQLKLKEKAQRQESNSLSNLKASLRKQEVIEKLWDQRDQINFIEDSEAKKSIENVLNLLDQGKLRVCEKKDDIWHVNQWLKKAILLSFRIQDMEMINCLWFL